MRLSLQGELVASWIALPYEVIHSGFRPIVTVLRRARQVGWTN